MGRLSGASRTIGALAVLTAVTVGGATAGDAGPTGAVQHAQRFRSDPPAARADPHPDELLNPTVRDSLRSALRRVREHDPLPERAPDREPRYARQSPATVAARYAESGIPAIAAQAYHEAARNIDAELPACRLSWSLLAGIGRIESDHGRFGGALFSPNGDVSPVILGPALTGAHGTARIADTDNGEYDGNRRVDRAVGPMQFLPGTWAVVGADGNGDGTADPSNIFDAALGAAEYLCAGDRDLSRPADQRAAVFSYNHSDAYVAEVLRLAALYRDGRTPTGPALSTDRSATPEPSRRQSPAAAHHRRVPAHHRWVPAHHPRVPAHHPRSGRPASTSPTAPSTSDSTTPPSSRRPVSPTGSSPSGPTSPPSSSPSGPTSPPSSSSPSPNPPSSSTPTAPPPTAPARPGRPRITGSADPVIATSATPTFTVSGSDERLVYTFELWPADHQGQPIGGGRFRARAGQAGRWTVPAEDALADGASYALRVRATNSAGTSAWSSWLDFTVTRPSDPSSPPSSTSPSSSPSASDSPSSDSPSSSPSASDQPTTAPS